MKVTTVYCDSCGEMGGIGSTATKARHMAVMENQFKCGPLGIDICQSCQKIARKTAVAKIRIMNEAAKMRKNKDTYQTIADRLGLNSRQIAQQICKKAEKAGLI